MQPVPVVKRESPVKRFAGSVELPAYLTAADVLAWSATVAEYERLVAESEDSRVTIERALSVVGVWHAGICKIVRRWQIEGLPEYLEPEQFPAAPQRASKALREWLIGEINALYFVEEDVPNG